MISKRASLGLKVIAHIASTPSHRTTTADSLASATGVSLSYIEGILKDAREWAWCKQPVAPAAATNWWPL